MESKELKIQIPVGYEIDKDHSTFECIKFKPIKKYITYEDVCNTIFVNNDTYFISDRGYIHKGLLPGWDDTILPDRHIVTNEKQLKKLLALNQLLNIAEYYNRKSKITKGLRYKITYIEYAGQYDIHFHNVGDDIEYGISVIFNSKDDAQAVIDNPNFREILNLIYK